MLYVAWKCNEIVNTFATRIRDPLIGALPEWLQMYVIE